LEEAAIVGRFVAGNHHRLKDANALIAWLNRVCAHGGGNNDGEAVERALETIHDAGQRPQSLSERRAK
jgi:hypothetical protein